jgi:hypothetical protein
MPFSPATNCAPSNCFNFKTSATVNMMIAHIHLNKGRV